MELDSTKAAELSTIAANFWVIVAGLTAGVIATLVWLFNIARWSARVDLKIESIETGHDDTKTEVKEKNTALWAKLEGMQTSMNVMIGLMGELKGRLDARDERK